MHFEVRQSGLEQGSACYLQTIMKTVPRLKVLICKMGTTVTESQWKGK